MAEPDCMSCDITGNCYSVRERERAVAEEEQQKAKSRGNSDERYFYMG